MTETIEQAAIAAAQKNSVQTDSGVAKAPQQIDLEPCPCGKTPEGLYIELQNPTQIGSKMGAAAGSCCATWRVEFLNHYAQGQESLNLAVQAWNDAPRG